MGGLKPGDVRRQRFLPPSVELIYQLAAGRLWPEKKALWPEE